MDVALAIGIAVLLLVPVGFLGWAVLRGYAVVLRLGWTESGHMPALDRRLYRIFGLGGPLLALAGEGIAVWVRPFDSLVASPALGLGIGCGLMLAVGYFIAFRTARRRSRGTRPLGSDAGGPANVEEMA